MNLEGSGRDGNGVDCPATGCRGPASWPLPTSRKEKTLRSHRWPILTCLLALAGSPSGLLGQGRNPDGPLAAEKLLGVTVGANASRQLWSYTFDSEAARGPTLGVFMEVPTPVRHVSVRAEAGYSRYSSRVWNPRADPNREGESEIRSHYLYLPLHGAFRVAVGPLSLYGFGGPTMGLLLGTGCRADVCSILQEEAPITFGVGIGSGMSLRIGETMEIGLEVRLTEGLSEAYRNQGSGARWRTVELLLRAGAWR